MSSNIREIIRFFDEFEKFSTGRSTNSTTDWNGFFDAIDRQIETARSARECFERTNASAFNVFDLIDPDENKLSDILATLLDPKGSHGQGDLFLVLMLEQLGLAGAQQLARNAKVQREAPTYSITTFRRRIDILVEAGLLLAIENKIDSPEQHQQVLEYLSHLDNCSADQNLGTALIYLTPDGRMPISLKPQTLKQRCEKKQLYVWSYRAELRDWLTACRDRCQAPKMQMFLSDLILFIEKVLARPILKMEEADET